VGDGPGDRGRRSAPSLPFEHEQEQENRLGSGVRDRHDAFGAGFVEIDKLIIGVVCLKLGFVLFQVVRRDGLRR
jgi:hypothetical protein